MREQIGILILAYVCQTIACLPRLVIFPQSRLLTSFAAPQTKPPSVVSVYFLANPTKFKSKQGFQYIFRLIQKNVNPNKLQICYYFGFQGFPCGYIMLSICKLNVSCDLSGVIFCGKPALPSKPLKLLKKKLFIKCNTRIVKGKQPMFKESIEFNKNTFCIK